VLVGIHLLLQVHHSLKQVTEKGKKEEGDQSVGEQFLLEGLVKSPKELEVRLQQTVAGLPWDVVVEQHLYLQPLEPLFALSLSLMCALIHYQTEGKAVDPLQAQVFSTIKIQQSITNRH
jgi:hypothetical protein